MVQNGPEFANAYLTILQEHLGRAGEAPLLQAFDLGRMAFTNYLAESVIFGWIFYGYGFGLFGRVGVVAALAIGVCVYLAQVLISARWLRYYRFGPIEWLWRTLMYGKPQLLGHG